MQIELGGIIMAAVMILGAFCTVLKFAFDAKSMAEKANDKSADLQIQITELKTKLDANETRIFEKLSEIEKALARIQGRLDINTSPN